MIHPKIDAQRFITLVSDAPLIAFQWFEYGAAVAAPGEAYYAPIDHPSGGNLDSFLARLALASLIRMSQPALRTLRPTAQPIPTPALISYLRSLGEIESSASFDKAAGDHPAVIEFQTQVVINAIEQHGRPDLQAAMDDVKREALADALDLVIDHAGEARELCEVGEAKPLAVRLNIMQATQAMKSALELLLKP